MLKAVLEALFSALVAFVLGRREQDLARADAKAEARAEGAAETAEAIAEVADEQARVAADRGPDRVDALAAELRARAARLAAGDHGRAG